MAKIYVSSKSINLVIFLNVESVKSNSVDIGGDVSVARLNFLRILDLLQIRTRRQKSLRKQYGMYTPIVRIAFLLLWINWTSNFWTIKCQIIFYADSRCRIGRKATGYAGDIFVEIPTPLKKYTYSLIKYKVDEMASTM